MEFDTVRAILDGRNLLKIVIETRPNARFRQRCDLEIGDRGNERLVAAVALERGSLDLQIHPRDEARRVICHALLGKAAGKFLIGRRGIPSHPIGVDGIIGDDLEQLIVEATGPLISTV